MPDTSEIRINPAVSLRQRSVPVTPPPVSPAHIEKLGKRSSRRKTLCTWGALLVMVALSIASLACALVLLTRQSNAGNLKRQAAVPIMNGVNFPDPAVIRTSSGWHLFSTNAKIDGKWVNIQRASTTNWKDFTFQRGVDALPKLPAWVDSHPRVWAPDVVRLEDGTFLMYYTAAWKARPNIHCLSYATAKKITDPFVDITTEPWICPYTQGGAIDIAGYTDEKSTTTKRYIVYKIDGNALGHGGACGNTVPPIVPTPIKLQEVSRVDGVTRIGSPITILSNIPSDGPYIEAPALTYFNGKYTLFFSSNCYQGDKYDVQYATATNIRGPYTRQGQLLRTNGPFQLLAPGGLDVAINGDRVVWHAKHNPVRPAYVGKLGARGDGKLEVTLGEIESG
ncbi:hypothetical protein BST61_g6545 [Cercospora zeina]